TRVAVNAGMFSYGTCALGWLFVDDVLVHFVALPGVTVDSGLHWPGTAIVLLLAAAASSGAAFLRAKLSKAGGWVDRQTGGQRRLRRFVAGPLLALGSVTAAFAILLLGTAWRHHTSDSTGSATPADPIALEPNTPTEAVPAGADT